MKASRVGIYLLLVLFGGCSAGGAATSPDLSADSLSMAPAMFAAGGQANLSFNLRNAGGTDAGPFSYRVLLTAPSGGSPITVADKSVGGLGKGKSERQSFLVTIPVGTAAGSYALSVVVDSTDAVSESDEANNRADLATPVTVLPSSNDVNLAVSAVSLSTSSALRDDLVTVSYTLSNTGSSTLLSNTTTHFFLSSDGTLDGGDRKVGEQSVGALTAGQSAPLQAQVTIPSDAAAGNYTLLVVADAPGSLVETDENDNVGGAALSVSTVAVGGIDLVITALSVTPSSVPRGGMVTVRFSLKNRGDRATDSSFFNRILISTSATPNPASDPTVDTVNVTSLGAGQEMSYERQVTLPSSMTPGTYYVSVFADPSNVLTETDKNNNLRTDGSGFTVTPPPQSDVLVENVSLPGTSGTVTAGASISVSFDVRNLGPQATSSLSANIILSTDTSGSTQRLLQVVTVPNVDSGASATRSETVTLPTDLDNRRYFIGVVVDPDARINDPVRANNTAFENTGFQVSGGSGCNEDALEPNDGIGSARAISPGVVDNLYLCSGNEDWYLVNVPAGSSVRVRMTSSDAGSPDLDLSLWAPGPNGEKVDSSTNVSSNEEVGADFVSVGGDYAIQVVGFLGDGGSYSLEVEVIPAGGDGIDLVPLSVAFTPGHADPMEEVNVTFEVKNAGMVASPAFRFELRLVPVDQSCTEEIVLGTFDATALAAGESRTIEQAATIPPGSCYGEYTLHATLDPEGLITETYETNNATMAAGPFRVGGIGGCVDDAMEPNDAMAAARVIGPGDYENLRMCTDDEDWYAVFLGAGETLEVTIDFRNNDGDIDIALRNEAGTTLDSATSSSANRETVTYTATTSQRIYIRVLEYFTSEQFGNGYTMKVTGGAGVDLLVRDLTFSPASQAPGADVQVRFNVENLLPLASTATTAEVRFVSAGGAQTLGYTANVDALGGGGSSVQAFDLKFPLPALDPGEYQVRVVVDPAGSVDEATKANNTLEVSGFRAVAPCTPDAEEMNDSSGEATDATPTSNPRTFSNLNICLGDADWFKVEVPSGPAQTLSAQILFTHAQGDLDLYLYGPGGGGPLTELMRSTTNTDDESVSQSVSGNTTYYLRVVGFDSSVTGNYSLEVSLSP